MSDRTSQTHSLEELDELLTQIREKFLWLGDYL